MRLHIVGGIRGSGKTTAITNASKLLLQEGIKVAVIAIQDDTMNNQTEILENIIDSDCVFVESAGFCSDFVTTIAKPLLLIKKELFDSFTISVFVDSQLLLSYLLGNKLPFSNEISYTFIKQIEEADLLVINKIDLLPAADFGLLYKLTNTKYGRKILISQNSFNPQNIQNWLTELESLPRQTGSRNTEYQISGLDIDLISTGEYKQRLQSGFPLILLYRVPKKQSCCEECLCAKNISSNQVIACPCKTNTGKSCSCHC